MPCHIVLHCANEGNKHALGNYMVFPKFIGGQYYFLQLLNFDLSVSQTKVKGLIQLVIFQNLFKDKDNVLWYELSRDYFC